MAKRKPKVKTIGTKLRPSNADRYLNCPASVVAAQDFPVEGGTIYTNTGTVVHAVIENCINTGNDPDFYIDQIVCDADIKVNHDMIRSARFCLDWIKEQRFTSVTAEQYVKLPWIKNPNGETTTGKVDFVGYDEDFSILKVGDYKNGFQPVEESSYQFGLYASALILGDDAMYSKINQVTSVLVQPNSKLGEIIAEREWNRGDLIRLKAKVNFATDWVKKTKFTDLNDKDYCDGTWCKFCPLSKTSAGNRMCPRKTNAMFKSSAGAQAVEIVQAGPLPVPSTMTREQRSLVLGKRKDIKKWLDDVYELELANAEAGDVPPGMKLVDGRALTRNWLKGVSEKDLRGALIDSGLMEDECYNNKLITPANVKKILKGKIPDSLQELMTPEGKSTELVSIDDKRNASDGSDLFN